MGGVLEKPEHKALMIDPDSKEMIKFKDASFSWGFSLKQSMKKA